MVIFLVDRVQVVPREQKMRHLREELLRVRHEVDSRLIVLVRYLTLQEKLTALGVVSVCRKRLAQRARLSCLLRQKDMLLTHDLIEVGITLTRKQPRAWLHFIVAVLF